MAVHPELTPSEAADRLAIRELFDAYAHCADRRDLEGQKALFTVDSRFTVYMDGEGSEPTYVLVGREALEASARPVLRLRRRLRGDAPDGAGCVRGHPTTATRRSPYSARQSTPGALMHRGRCLALGYVERLATRYQVVAMDPLGHGESDKPVVPAAYDLVACANHVVAVLDDLGVDRAAASGYSRGGAIVATLLGHRPDRLWAAATGGFGFSETPTWSDEAIAALEVADWDGFFARSGLVLPDHVRQYMTELNDPRAIAAAFRRAGSCELVAAASPVPVLMYNGDGEDEDVLDSGAAESSGFDCRVLPTGGHAATFGSVDAVWAVVEPFLASAHP